MKFFAEDHAPYRPVDLRAVADRDGPPSEGVAASAGCDPVVAAMIRVDHAGEFGAVRIYDGQVAILGERAVGGSLRHMRQQEREHLARFGEQLAERRVRPTALLPLWHIAGFALGAATALLGEEAAMACTEAVEDTVVAHYDGQIARLDRREPALSALIARIRDEEREHGDHAVAAGARRAPGYRPLYGLISRGCRAAIAVSERI